MYKKTYQILFPILTIILGTILHFTYQLSNENLIVGFFSPINESTWEHLKMLISPMILFSIIEYFLYGKNIQNFFSVRALSILIGMFLITSLFYTYTGIFGNNYLIVDILIFVLSVIISYYFSYKFFNKNFLNSNNSNFIGLISIFILVFAMIYFTSNPLDIPLFKSPV